MRIGEWRELHNDKLYDLHTSLNATRRLNKERWYCREMCGEKRNVYRLLIRKAEKKNILGKSRILKN
jgi:hypothetical protein